ncbi:MAG: ATP-binding protein, partial [Flavobacterium sp.]
MGNGLTIADLTAGTYISYARNKKVADLFREAGIIEKYGSGIKRITQAFLNYGLSAPVFESLPNGFQVTVYTKVPETVDGGVNGGVSGGVGVDVGVNVGANVGVNGGVSGGVNGGVKSELEVTAVLLFDFIEKNPGVTILTLCRHFNIPKRTVERWIKKLKEQG